MQEGRIKLCKPVVWAALLAGCVSLSLYAQEKSVLEQARLEAGAGHFRKAGELYQQVLESQPENREALGSLADALEATGQWRAAIAPLSRLVELEPQNAARLLQLGRMESWRQGGRANALRLLKNATELQPDNVDYQLAYAEVLSWNAADRLEALRVLRTVLAGHPTEVKARRLHARILGWQRQRDAALAVLEPLTSRPRAEAEDFWTRAQVEEASGEMQAATFAYRKALEKDADHLPSIRRLAEILSWQGSTRPEAARLFERGLQLVPNDEALLDSYAEMLSWNRDTRLQAMKYYDQALVKNPSDVRALAGKAQLLGWTGNSHEALVLYDRALALNPSNASALRGKAEILNWRGRNSEALALLMQAKDIERNDSRILLDLARADYELHNYAAARADLIQVQGVTTPEASELQRNVNHALGTYLELGYGLRRNRRRLDYHRLQAVVSTPLGTSNRLSVSYRPTLYQTQQGDFNANDYAIALDSEPSDRLTTHVSLAGESFPGAPPQLDGAFDFRYRLQPSFEVQAGFERAPAEETLLSMRGMEFNGLFLSQARSNLGSINGSYTNSRHHFDASLTYTDGIYTGRNIDSNRRWSLDGNLGKSLHSFQPYVRLAYGFTYLSFDHDADFQPGAAPTRDTGGYFSPTRFLLNYGSLSLAHRITRRLRWDADGSLGAQNVQTSDSSFSTARFASTFTTHLIWNVNDKDDLTVGYDFLNVFNAFRRNLLVASWRRYF